MSCSKIKDCDEEWPAWAEKAAKEYFPSWNRYLNQWKYFSSSSDPEHGLIRSYVGISLFGVPKNINKPSEVDDPAKLWRKYSKKKCKIIKRIVGQFKFSKDDIAVVNHTYLYLKDHTVHCVFRQNLPDGTVSFIDVYGRLYKSWQHFCKTNLLKSCKYLAPKDGIHQVDQKLEIFVSSGNILPRWLKVIAISSTFVALALAIAGVGPVMGTICGIVGIGYGVGNCLYTLIDRYGHNQSIGYRNLESVICWLTLATAALNGVSWWLLKNISNIAEYWLVASSFLGLGSGLANFGVHLYYLIGKYKNGEKISLTNFLQIGVNVLLAGGAAYVIWEVYSYVRSLEIQPINPAGDPSELTVDTSAVQEVVAAQLTMLKENWKFVQNIPAQLILKNSNEDTKEIYNQCVSIGKFCEEYETKKIDIQSFYNNLKQHGLNLYSLLQRKTATAEAEVSSYLGNVPGEADEIPLTSDLRTRDHIIHTLFHPKYAIIIHLAKNRIPQTVQHNEILSSFSDQLRYVIDTITSKVANNYTEFCSKRESLMQRTEAEELLNIFGISSENNFANLNFLKIVEELEERFQPVVHSIETEQITEKLCAMYEKRLFRTDAQDGTLETCEKMKKSLEEKLQPLREIFESCVKLYEFDFSLFGRNMALDLTAYTITSKKRQLDGEKVMQTPSSILFDVALKKNTNT